MKRRWFGMTAVVLTACAVSVFSARRIEAQYSSPVKVANTTSAPAITSRMDDPGRIAYQAIGFSSCNGSASCTFSFAAIPAAHRLVIQQVSGTLSNNNGNFNASIYASLGTPSFVPVGAFTIYVPFSGASFLSQVRAYIDAGETPSVVLNTGSVFSVSGQVTLAGYMLDCTAAPCSAIVAQ
jgi:hypothetical protein